MATLSADAPITISMSASSSCAEDGFTINLPFTRPTLTSEIGPLNGISEIAKAADAPNPANPSGDTLTSCEIN